MNETTMGVPIEMRRIVSNGVLDQFSIDEIEEAFSNLEEQMKAPDPLNPDMWTVHVGDRRVWGILDRGCGWKGRAVLTILLPEEY